MAITAEFFLPADSFPFGRATSGDSSVEVEIERLVPLGTERIPYLRVTGECFEAFERRLRESPIVDQVEVLSRTDDHAVYAITWDTTEETFLNGLHEASGTIMDARGDGEWWFTVRFPDQDALSRFHEFCRNEHFPIQVERVCTLEAETQPDLTPKQREAVLLALQRGYFKIPRETTLEEIADELGITRQAASERVRRGVEPVLWRGLTGPLTAAAEPADEMDAS